MGWGAPALGICPGTPLRSLLFSSSANFSCKTQTIQDNYTVSPWLYSTMGKKKKHIHVPFVIKNVVFALEQV